MNSSFPSLVFECYPGGYSQKNMGRGVRPASQNPYPIYDQNGGKIAKIDTQFKTKTAEKPYPLGPHIPMKPILGSTPPGNVKT